MAIEEKRVCQNCKQNFVIEPEDFEFYDKIKVPSPTWCPECRLIRRLAWRNERSLYHSICAKCKKPMISVFPQNSGFNVYCRPCWWSDDWDGLEYGVEYNSKRPFLTQLHELLQRAPVMGLFGIEHTLENCQYTNMVSYLKNCYLTTYADNSENCSYSSFIDKSKDSFDNLMLFESELCYENVNCRKCYQSKYSLDCESCNNILFCRNCISCSNCIGCVNLRNKKYHIFNKPYLKEEYEQLAKEFSLATLREKTNIIWQAFPQKYMHERHNLDVSGDYIDNSKNTHNTFIAHDIEDSRFCSFISPGNVKDSYDFTHYGNTAELVYDSLQIGDQASKILFSWFAVSNVHGSEYGIFLAGCQDTFGSVSIKKKKYCILNKQYSQEEYEKLRAKIVKEMNENPYKDLNGNIYPYGEYFPIEMSPFGYNNTSAQESFPLTKDEVLAKGYAWRDPEARERNISIKAADLPESILYIKDSVLQETIGCEHKGKCNEQCSVAFRIIPSELEFYQKQNIPLPRLCPNCRHYQRLKQRSPLKLWHRKCQCLGIKSENGIYQNTAQHFHLANHCPNEFETSYAPDRPEIVYCEQCYQAEVV